MYWQTAKLKIEKSKTLIEWDLYLLRDAEEHLTPFLIIKNKSFYSIRVSVRKSWGINVQCSNKDKEKLCIILKHRKKLLHQ